MPITIHRINITPIKGTALQQADTVWLDDSGVFANRRFYLIDADGIMINGKRAGPLVTLQTHYDAPTQGLRILFPDGTCLTDTVRCTHESVVTDFYGRPVCGQLVEGPWNQALSDFAGRPVRLIRAADDTIGTDVHPVTLVSCATLEKLRMAANGAAERWADRFRMMFELDGPDAFEEDGWIGHRLAAGEAIMRVVGLVPRCLVTSQDPATGVRDTGTLAALTGLRSNAYPIPAQAGDPTAPRSRLMLGLYAIVEQPGRVRVGEPLTASPA
ncbi:MOSC domain-containing protein [Castellaniella sp.]|uniref:MOSC domain-containing protein n=1 Tax=Castellaniella sp. TaxID=1955812 RepID=UPI00355F672B